MLPKLLAEHGHGLVVQRHADRFVALRFVGMNPCCSAVHINVGPFQSEHVGSAAITSSESEGEFNL
jgi:hypothetical protein